MNRGLAFLVLLVVIGAATGAVTSLLTVFGDIRDVQRALAWMAGSIYNADWAKLRWLAVWSLPALAITWCLARDLDLSAFDDDVSGALGLTLQAMRAMLIALCTLLAGASVAAAGSISFVGLLAPQIVRGLSPRHAIRLPAAGRRALRGPPAGWSRSGRAARAIARRAADAGDRRTVHRAPAMEAKE